MNFDFPQRFVQTNYTWFGEIHLSLSLPVDLYSIFQPQRHLLTRLSQDLINELNPDTLFDHYPT